ncbi:MAG: hypothetical protein J0M34_00530 [Alphaproteobacteria bacterium]|nr:hypothetical protein [Alphaproteobacteria bacterium]
MVTQTPQQQTEKTNDSEHVKPSALDVLRQNTPKILTDNAPRVVAGFKIAGSAAMIATGNWAFRVAGSMFILGNIVMSIFGQKKTDEEREKLQNQEAIAIKSPSNNPFLNHMGKVVNPQKYPIESALSIFSVGSIFWALSGLVKGKGGSLGGGLFSMASDLNGALNKENTDDDRRLKDLHSPQDWFQYFKNRPILTSSLLNIGADVTTAVDGIKHLRTGNPFQLVAGLSILCGNIFQAIYVNKNDYNIEKRKPLKDTAAQLPLTQAATSAPATRIDTVSHESLLQLNQAQQQR